MKQFTKFLINLIPSKKLRNKLKQKMNSPQITTTSKYYGKIYIPYYPDVKFWDGMPEIYNKNGEKLDVYFLRDKDGCHCPYMDSSKYFLWDRFNIGLKTHFYTHSAILETMGEPERKYALFIESESIIPQHYAIFDKHKGIEKDFKKVITYSERLLDKLDNALLFPACASVWYSKEYFNGVLDPTEINENVWQQKTKNVSMICSAKLFTPMHKIRHKIAEEAMKTGKVDMFGGFKDGKMFPYKSSTLTDYRFQIVVENDVTAYYFTEKLMDCLVSMTIPIYLGATRVETFFNPDGIIQIDKDTNIEEVLKQCTEEEYLSRLDAIKDNYYRALKYVNLNDYLYETINKK